MKKVLLIWSLLLITILAGCSKQELLKENELLKQQLLEQEKNIEKQSNDNFKKAQECEKYSNEIAQSMNKKWGEELIIFYSPSLNTCIYGWREYEWWGAESMPSSIYFLADVLPKQNIYFWRNDHTERDAKIAELK